MRAPSSFRRATARMTRSHVRISPDTDFRHPSRPALPRPDRQFPSRQRAYRHRQARSRRQHRRRLASTGRPAATMSNSPRACTTPCPSPAATSPAITTSATIRPRSALRRSRRSTEAHRQQFRDDHRRRPLVVRGRRLVLHRPQLAGDELRARLRGRAVRLARLGTRAHERQAGRAVRAQAAISQRARRSRDAGDLDPLRAAAGARATDRDVRALSTCGSSPAVTCTSGATSPGATPATSGRRRPAS